MADTTHIRPQKWQGWWGWRGWLGTVAGAFLVMGVLALSDTGVSIIDRVPNQWWGVLWVPAGVMGVVMAVANRPPRGKLYSILPTMLAVGTAARAMALADVGAWLPTVAWFLLAGLVAWGWGRALAPVTVMGLDLWGQIEEVGDE